MKATRFNYGRLPSWPRELCSRATRWRRGHSPEFLSRDPVVGAEEDILASRLKPRDVCALRSWEDVLEKLCPSRGTIRPPQFVSMDSIVGSEDHEASAS